MSLENNRYFFPIASALALAYAIVFYPHSLESIKTVVITGVYYLANHYTSHDLTISQPLWYGSFTIDIYNTLLKYLEVKGICHIKHHFMTSGKNCDVLVKSLVNLILIDIITLGISYKLQIQVPFLWKENSKGLHFILSIGLVLFAVYVIVKYKLVNWNDLNNRIEKDWSSQRAMTTAPQ